MAPKNAANLLSDGRRRSIIPAIAILAASTVILGLWSPSSRQLNLLRAQSPQKVTFQVDPFWPKPLADDWVTGNVGGTCVDSNDHVFIVNRTADPANLTDQEKAIGRPAPAVIEFDPEGNVVHTWGDPKVVPHGIHACYFDHAGNIWIGGNTDAIVQKYSHAGKLLMQIGEKERFDTSDGTAKGTALNSSHTLLNEPSGFAVDPLNEDVYISDGYGNRRIVVFDRDGKYDPVQFWAPSYERGERCRHRRRVFGDRALRGYRE